MDYIAHGLWGVGLFRRYGGVKKALLFGVMADTISFVPYFLLRTFGTLLGVNPFGPPRSPLPDWVQMTYNIGHSLFVSFLVILTIWAIRRKFPIYALGWPLAILIDVPVHTADRFPTPFLWPLFDYRFDGISWATPWVMILNYSLIALVFLVPWLWQQYKKFRR